MTAAAHNLVTTLLPARAPDILPARLALYAIRRMAIGGLNDAHAANALMGTFGLSYRRPVLLLRAFLLEMARCSRRKIQIAGCCCRRMTADEALMMEALGTANMDPDHGRAVMHVLLDTPDTLAALSSAQAVSQAFEDLGRPLTGEA